MTTRSLIRIFLLGAIALFCGTTTANAQLVGGESILLDFGNQADVDGVVLPANTNQVVSTDAVTGLIELGSSRDTAVGLAVTTTGTRGAFFNDDSGDLGGPPNTGTGVAIPGPFNSAILEDWSGISGGSYIITLSGLDDSLTYEIVYALGGFSGNNATDNITITIGGQVQPIGVASVDPKFFTFSDLSTDGAGNLVVQLDPVNVSGESAVPVISGLVLTAVGGQGFLLGDVNQDGSVDFLDISPFITLLSSGQFQLEADVNEDTAVDFLDISPFISLLSS